MTFGERLKEARLKKKLTQEELAKQIGVAKSTLTGYEKGNREPDFFKIQKLTSILDVNADYLLGVEDTSLEKTIKKYELLNDEYKILIDNQINQLLEIQQKAKEGE